MKNNKTVLYLLITLFVVVVVILVSTFFVMNKSSNKNEEVLVVNENILEGEKIQEGKLKVVVIEKSSMSKNYFKKSDYSKVNGKIAKSDLYKNEFLTKERVKLEDKETGVHSISLNASNISTDINKGDFIQIIVKPKFFSEVFTVIDSKKVEKIEEHEAKSLSMAKGSKAIQISITDEEFKDYQKALSIGEIIVVKYEDVSNKEKQEISYQSAASLIERVIENAMDERKRENYYYASIHEIAKGEKLEEIAASYTVSVKQIKEMNPNIKKYIPGQLIRVN